MPAFAMCRLQYRNAVNSGRSGTAPPQRQPVATGKEHERDSAFLTEMSVSVNAAEMVHAHSQCPYCVRPRRFLRRRAMT